MSTVPVSTGTNVSLSLFHAFLWAIVCIAFIAIAVAGLLASSWWWTNFPNGPPLHYAGIGLALGFLFLAAVAIWNSHKSVSSAFD